MASHLTTPASREAAPTKAAIPWKLAFIIMKVVVTTRSGVRHKISVATRITAQIEIAAKGEQHRPSYYQNRSRSHSHNLKIPNDIDRRYRGIGARGGQTPLHSPQSPNPGDIFVEVVDGLKGFVKDGVKLSAILYPQERSSLANDQQRQKSRQSL